MKIDAFRVVFFAIVVGCFGWLFYTIEQNAKNELTNEILKQSVEETLKQQEFEINVTIESNEIIRRQQTEINQLREEIADYEQQRDIREQLDEVLPLCPANCKLRPLEL